MSIFGSLTTGISGLQAQAAALGHISDNIANARTTGYKRVDTAFTNLVLQSNSRVHSPGGVVARPSYANSVAGNIETVDRTTNLAIRGQGFFNVSRMTEVNGQTVPTSERFYTRDGTFELDNDRILVNRSGFALNGYIYNEASNSFSTTATPIQVTADIDSPVPTKEIELRANLPKTPTPGQPITPTNIPIYDATGTRREVTLGWRPGQTEGSWRMTLDAPGARDSLPLSGSLDGYPVSAQSTSLTQGAAARKQIEEVQFTTPNADGAFKIGDTYRVSVNGTEFTETITTINASSLTNLTGVAQSLADKINGAVPPVGVTATVSNGRLRVSATTAGDDFKLTTSVNNASPTVNTIAAPVTTPATSLQQQQSVITFAGSAIDIGDEYTLNIDNTTAQAYTVKVTAANIGQLKDLNGVVTALAAQVNANSSAEKVNASVTGNTLTLRGSTVGDSFSVGEQTGTQTTAPSSTDAQVTELSYPNRNISTEEDDMSVTINGTTITYTPVAGNDMNTELTAFAAEINGQALGVTATIDNNRLILTADAVNTSFAISARDRMMQANVANAPPADNTTYISSVQGNIEGARQTQRLSLTGVPGDVGATYSLTLRSPTTIQVDPIALEGTTTTQPSATEAQVTQISYPSKAPKVGDVYSATINGTAYSYGPLTQADLDSLPTQPPIQSEALETLFLPAITSPDVSATVSGNTVVLTAGAPDTPFRVTGTDSLATDPSSQLFDFSTSTSTPVIGNRYAATMNGTTYSVQITEQNITDFPTPASVLDSIITKIGNDFGAPFTASAVKSNGVTTGIMLTAKDATVTLDGTQEVAPNFNRTVSYETTGDEVSLDDIAAKLAAKVSQQTGIPIQATSAGGVLTLTGNQDGISFLAEPTANIGTTPAHITLNFGGTLPNGEAAKAGTLSSLSSANVGTGNATVSAVTESGQPAQVTFTVDYGDGPQRITLDLGTYGEPSGITLFDGNAINVVSQLQDGSAQGTFRDVEVRENGDVVANYDNGRKRVIAQVPLVLFNNANALSRETGGTFAETSESGRARFTSTGINGAGTIAASSTEGSNVDIAQEFTKLIVAQRSYTANTRVITTTDEMLTETINLKR